MLCYLGPTTPEALKIDNLIALIINHKYLEIRSVENRSSNITLTQLEQMKPFFLFVFRKRLIFKRK